MKERIETALQVLSLDICDTAKLRTISGLLRELQALVDA